MVDEARIADLRDMLAALHFEALAFPRRDGTALDMAMKRVEREFGHDPDFARRFG